MWGYSKKKALTAGAALLASFSLLCAGASASPLCEEDEYIGIPSGVYSNAGGEGSDKVVRYYDCDGNPVGSALKSIDYFLSYQIIGKDRLITTYNDTDQIILSTNDFSEIARFSRNSVRCAFGAAYFALYDTERGLLSCYDRTGRQLFLVRPAEPPAAPAQRTYLGDLYEADGYAFVELVSDGETCFRVIFGDDGSCVTSDETSFPEAFRGNVCAAAGQYLVVKREAEDNTEEEAEYLVYTRDGTLVTGGFTEVGGYEPWVPTSFSHYRAAYLYRREGDGVLVYDAQLRFLGRVAHERLTDWGSVEYAGSEIVGLPSDKLNGAVVDGSVQYHGKEVPYTLLDGGYLIAAPGGYILLALPQEETLSAVSDGLVLTVKDEEKIVRRRSDMAEVFRTGKMVSIQDDSFYVARDYQTDGDMHRIYDENGVVLYESDYWISACPRGNYCIIRGPYVGIADRDGNWIIRELRYEE